jgi:hypothetical protein
MTRQMMCEDDVEAGVLPTMTMMASAATRMRTGGTAEMPDGVQDKFEALPKKDGAKFPPLRGCGVPPYWDRDWPGGGEDKTLTTGARQSSGYPRGKNQKGQSRRGGQTYARNFERALYMSKIGPLMLPRGQQWGRGRCNVRGQ